MKNILIVDDSPEIIELIELYLETHLKFENIFTASCGIEAIDHLNNENFSLIISDYQMPDGDGVSILHYLKNNKDSTPFILMGGDLSAQKNGRVHLLHKPFGRDELLRVIKNATSDKTLDRPIA
ncbi:MAG: response regulator [Bdellovibrionales bacterium]|nr:response regulator [Bdellovibrionales bacterium]